jgi:hypothetical protein
MSEIVSCAGSALTEGTRVNQKASASTIVALLRQDDLSLARRDHFDALADFHIGELRRGDDLGWSACSFLATLPFTTARLVSPRFYVSDRWEISKNETGSYCQRRRGMAERRRRHVGHDRFPRDSECSRLQFEP